MFQEKAHIREKYSIRSRLKEYTTKHTINMVGNIPLEGDDALREMSVPLHSKNKQSQKSIKYIER